MRTIKTYKRGEPAQKYRVVGHVDYRGSVFTGRLDNLAVADEIARDWITSGNYRKVRIEVVK